MTNTAERTATLFNHEQGDLKFTAKETAAKGSCEGCAAQHDGMLCEALPACGGAVIWVKAEE